MLLTGLKRAVPILLGTFILQARTPDATRLYMIIFVLVAFSVLVKGGWCPGWRTGWGCRFGRSTEPWSLGVRLRPEPRALRRYQVAAGSAADGRAWPTCQSARRCGSAW